MKMWNLFKKEESSKPIQQKIVEVAVIEKEEEITSVDIQNDITFSLKDLMEEVNKPLERNEKLDLLVQRKKNFEQQNQELLNKIQNLEELGFVNTPSVRLKKTEFQKEVSLHEGEINLIQKEIDYFNSIKHLEEKYTLEYPSFKFIPTEVMTKIMKKYNIFMGDVELYNKEIPDRAIEIISNFKDKIRNSTKYIYLEKKTFHYGGHSHSGSYNFVYKKERLKSYEERVVENQNNYSDYTEVSSCTMLKMVAPLSHFTLSQSFTRFNKSILQIKDNRIYYDLTEVNKEMERLRELKDPIACLEVEGGFIILHAWDEEAKIPEIKNSMLN